MKFQRPDRSGRRWGLPDVLKTAAAAALILITASANAATFKIVNNCSQTIYPAVLPADYQNGGWSMAPNTNVSFTVPDNFSGRVWARKNCNSSSPAVCDTGQCGGTGLSCAGSSGWATTSLAEFTLAGTANGTDWYDVSDVDAYDFPIAITTPTGGYSPTATADVLSACPSNLRVTGQVSGTVAYCTNPCSVYKTPAVCCTSLSPQNCRDAVNQWPAAAQQYVNIIHNYEGEDYTYPWDDWWGLHTETAGSNPSGNTWTITFCPNNVQPTNGNVADNWPLAPTGIAGTNSSGHITITWNAVSGATSYKIYRAVNNGANNATNEDTPLASGLTGTSYTDSTVTSGTVYYYVVTAINATGFSAPSAQLTITAGGGNGTAPLPAPATISASAGSGSATITWSAVSGATSYSVFDSTSSLGEPSTAATTVTGTSATITGLTNGTEYFFLVTANNASGNGADSSEVNATPGSGGTTGGGTTGGTTGTEGPFGGSPAAVPGTVSAANYDTGGQGVGYSVTAVNGSANSYRSDGVDLEATSDSGGVAYDIGWTAASQWFRYTVNVATAGTYTVACRVSNGAAANGTFHIANSAGTNLSGTITVAPTGGWQTWTTVNATVTLPAGQQVLTFDQDSANFNWHWFSFTLNGATVPPAPTGLSASAGNSQVSLSWGASSGATSYNVYRGTSAGGESGTPVATGVTGTTYTNTGLTDGTTYYFKVAAVNTAGTSGQSNEASATPSSGSGGSTVAIDCGGAASSPFVADADFSGGTATSTTATISTSQLSGTIPSQTVLQSNRYGAFTYTIPGLTAGSSYTVTLYFAEEYWTASGKRVFNVAINGTSALSNFDIFATAGGENIAIQRSFTATANSSGQIVITTTNVTDNAQINGILISPAGGGGGSATNIDCGGTAASPFVADTDFSGGATASVTNAIDTSLLSAPVPPQAVLQSNRYGAFTYTIPGYTAGSSHTVTLYFAEEYWTAAGKRVFNVAINGATVLTNFDIYAQTGAEYKAIQENFSATANSSGQIVITTTNVTDNAQINGITVN